MYLKTSDTCGLYGCYVNLLPQVGTCGAAAPKAMSSPIGHFFGRNLQFMSHFVDISVLIEVIPVYHPRNIIPILGLHSLIYDGDHSSHFHPPG